MQRRNKVGGIFDRRFGEDDPTMTPEEKMLQRFAREKQSAHKKSSMFDLEDDGPSEGLTHMGRTLSFDDDEEAVDDFDENDLPSDEESDSSGNDRKRLKRLRIEQSGDGGDNEDDGIELPERKKPKQEVMKELIAKSKLYKYERAAAKDADDDLRKEIDKELPDLQALLFRGGSTQKGRQGGARTDEQASLRIAGLDKNQFDKDYDLRVKQLAQDKRAQPSERIKTEEEKAEEEAARLKELEEKRVKRMLGENGSDSEDEEGFESAKEEPEERIFDSLGNDLFAQDGADENEFGLGQGIKMRPTATDLGFDDEDDFVVDDDLVASGSEIDIGGNETSFDEDEEGHSEPDDEFTKGLLTESEVKAGAFKDWDKGLGVDSAAGADGLPFTFPCPQSHAELLGVLQDIPLPKMVTVIQRIRALYHPKLASDNKHKLANFARALVNHIAYLGNSGKTDAGLSLALESLIRHVHSLAKMFPLETSKEFRTQLQDVGQSRPLAIGGGDLAILTAVRSIFPTSDHFHQVVTPAMLTMARYLGQKIPQSLSDYAVSTYVSTLALDYQRLSKRYVPEVVNSCLNTLCSLAPEKPRQSLGLFPIHEPAPSIRIRGAQKTSVRRLNTGDCQPGAELDEASSFSLKAAIASTTVGVLSAAADTWSGKPAFWETFSPVLRVFRFLLSRTCRSDLPSALVEAIERTASKLERMLSVARLARRPLQLHHHRPLAIKTAIPKFEDGFDPKKHYNPDRERAELAKLKAEHRKERKGAMRELRKDANFVARESLRRKKERDAAYERKYKSLVAEIQGEEGKEANAYEREKKARKRAKRR